MIPRLLLAAVTACLAMEGYSVLTAPPGLVREVVAKVRGLDRDPATIDVG